MAGEYGSDYSKFKYDPGSFDQYDNPYHEEERYDDEILNNLLDL